MAIALISAVLAVSGLPSAASAVETTTVGWINTPTSPVGIYDPLTFSAKVYKTPPDGGTMDLVKDGVGLVSVNLNPNGVASFTLPYGLLPGTYTFEARFNGTPASAPSTSDPLTIEVIDDRTPVTVTLTSDVASPSLRGDPIGFHIAVSPDPGTGNVQLYRADTDALITLPTPIGAGGVKDVTWTPTATFTYSIKAYFSGNSTFQAEYSAPIEQDVYALATTTTLDILHSPMYQDEAVTFRVTVNPPPEIAAAARVGRGPGTGWWVGIDPVTGIGETTLVPFIVRTELGLGHHDLAAYFLGTPHTDPSNTAFGSLDIVQDATTTTASVEPTVVKGGDTSRISVSVNPPPTDLPLVGVFIAGWVAPIDLDAAGDGFVDFDTTGWLDGVYSVTTTFGGTDRIAASSDTDTITIDAAGPVGLLSINGGVATTSGTAVTLDVSATDAHSAVQWVELSNTGLDGEWTRRAYGPTQAWTLPSGNGQKTVYARWIDSYGHLSDVAQERIQLSAPTATPAPTPTPDGTAPVGSVSIAGGATYTKSTAVTVSVPATDVGSGVGSVKLSNDGLVWTPRPYAASQSWTLPATNGTRTVYVKWTDRAGNTSAIKTDTIVLDTTVPTVTAPSRGFVADTAIFNGRITTRVPWTGSDLGSGIARYELEQSTDGGAWTIISTTLTSPTATRTLTTQHTYRLRVRAVDKAGNLGGWATGATFRVSRYSESNPAIAYTGTWSTVSNPAYWGGATKKSTAAGAKASLTFTGRSIAWVARTGPDRGKAAIYVNGTQVATVDLYSASFHSQRVVWVGTWGASASRKVTIKVLGTSGRPRVDLDALVTAN